MHATVDKATLNTITNKHKFRREGQQSKIKLRLTNAKVHAYGTKVNGIFD